MDTVRAIAQMASAREEGLDPERIAAATHLNRISPQLHVHVNGAIAEAERIGLRPAADGATQMRLATAVERHAAGGEERRGGHSISMDLLLQEAASARLTLLGRADPYADLQDSDTQRPPRGISDALKASGINAAVILDRASIDDISHMAAGRYDLVRAGHTRFAIGTQLQIAEKALSHASSASPLRVAVAAMRGYPSAGVGKGPASAVEALPISKKNVAER